MVTRLAPLQQRRKKYEDNPKQVWDILEAGSARAASVAEATMNEVREAMKMSKQDASPAQGAGGP